MSPFLEVLLVELCVKKPLYICCICYCLTFVPEFIVSFNILKKCINKDPRTCYLSFTYL